MAGTGMATITTRATPNKSSRVAPAFPLKPAAAFIVLLFPLSGTAAEWRVTPTLSVQETYTDNVALTPAESAKSDFVTDLSPGINVAASGRGLKFNANYAYQYLNYAHGGKGDTGYNRLNAAGNIELARDLFAIDGTAAISQQNTSLLGPQAINNYAATDNRTTVKTITVSPYLHHDFRGIATSELRFTHTSADTDTAALSSSQSDGVILSIASDPSVLHTLGWGFSYNDQRNSLGNADAVNSSNVAANLRYLVTPQFSLTGSTGYDRYDYPVTSGVPSPHGQFYTGGFAWRPSERSSLSASFGHKFYGQTYSLDSSIRSRASVWRLSYDEAITNSLSQFTVNATDSTANFLDQLFHSSIPDDALRQQAVERFILSAGLPTTLTQAINYLSNQIFLQKTLRASVALTGARNTLVFTAFNMSRQQQSAQNGAPPLQGSSPAISGDTRQTGVDALWNWRVTALTTATLDANVSKSRIDFDNTDQHLKTFRAMLACRLLPKMDGILEFRHTTQTADGAGADYQENAISALVSMQF